ncbi:protein of unknown function [Kyrpidia spormannii]|uniref:Uncharacterized protein n=2 Tax=Kyrpidia spormannii TaxID=2055160 RepID=A0ACA8ZD80_9BACL|nr:protein of unknown function [Kyrpidia spormannii]CAB3395992.1 protein of unknown function [Kyrpidia spormannii]
MIALSCEVNVVPMNYTILHIRCEFLQANGWTAEAFSALKSQYNVEGIGVPLPIPLFFRSL